MQNSINVFKDFYLNVQLVHAKAKMPTRGTPASAGLDFYTPVDVIIPAGADVLVDLGLKLEMPDGFALIFKEKSGIATSKKLDVGGCVVDSDYRGVPKAHLFNNGQDVAVFKEGDKIVQGIIVNVWDGLPKQVERVDGNTVRGEGGFGSTGR